MTHYFWLIIIGLAYYFDKINGLFAVIFVVGLFIAEAFDKQDEKIHELSEKISGLTSHREYDDFTDTD